MQDKHQPAEIIGHRGAHGLAPDNTIAGFKMALEYGVSQIECDLRLSIDGIVVMAHDPELVNDTGDKLPIATTTYEDLKAFKPDLLTLDETIVYVNRRTRLMLEIKDHRATAPTIAIVRKYLDMDWLPSDFMIASFKYQPLAACKRALPEIELVVLDEWSGMRATHRARKLGTPYLSMNQAYLWPGFIRSVSRRYKLYCYPSATSLRPLRYRQPDDWAKYGLYGIITDRPDNFAKRSILKDNESHLPPARAADRDDQHILV